MSLLFLCVCVFFLFYAPLYQFLMLCKMLNNQRYIGQCIYLLCIESTGLHEKEWQTNTKSQIITRWCDEGMREIWWMMMMRWDRHMEVQYRVLDLRLSLRTIFDFYYYVFYSFHCVWYGKIIFYYISSYYWTLWWLTNYNKKMNVVVWHHLLVQCGPYMCARRSTLRGSGSFGKYVHKYRKTRSVVCSYISCVTASDSNTQQKYRRDVGCWSPISTRMVWEGLHRLVRRAKML